MKKINCLFALILALCPASLFAAETAPAPAPTPASETANVAAPTGPALEAQKRMEFLFEVSKKVNSATAAEKSKARADIDAALDWDKISEDAMGTPEWKKQAGKNRTDFRNLLKEVIVRTAYTRLDKFWEGASYSFGTIEAKNGKAHVPAKFTVSGEPFTLDYYMVSKGGKWLIYDIAFEGERYSVNINEQIGAFLREKSFANLMEKLRKRRNELAEEKPASKKS